MGWQDLLAPTGPEEVTLPWAGGKKVHSLDRTWALKGRQPPEHGWYTFTVDGGRTARLKDRKPLPAEPDFSTKTLRGYVVGDRFIQDGAAVDPDPTKLIQQTEQVYCVEPGLERFTRAKVFRDRAGRLIYLAQEQQRPDRSPLKSPRASWPACWAPFRKPCRGFSPRCPPSNCFASTAKRSTCSIRLDWRTCPRPANWRNESGPRRSRRRDPVQRLFQLTHCGSCSMVQP